MARGESHRTAGKAPCRAPDWSTSASTLKSVITMPRFHIAASTFEDHQQSWDHQVSLEISSSIKIMQSSLPVSANLEC